MTISYPVAFCSLKKSLWGVLGLSNESKVIKDIVSVAILFLLSGATMITTYSRASSIIAFTSSILGMLCINK